MVIISVLITIFETDTEYLKHACLPELYGGNKS